MFDTEQPPGTESSDAEQLEVVLDDDVAKGIYANLVNVTHSREEFVLDFIRVMPGSEEGSVMSRLIITPSHAERLLDTLARHVMSFEENHGRLNEAGLNSEETPRASSEERLPSVFLVSEAEA